MQAIIVKFSTPNMVVFCFVSGHIINLLNNCIRNCKTNLFRSGKLDASVSWYNFLKLSIDGCYQCVIIF